MSINLDGMRLKDWLTLVIEGANLRPGRHWGRLLRLTAQSALNELLYQEEERQLAARIEAQRPAPPIFVLGYWRSGTTLLHNLLCQDTRLAYPTTRQTLHPHSFFILEGELGGPLAGLLKKAHESWSRLLFGGPRGPAPRPIDGVLVGADTPQEDEFAMLMMRRSVMVGYLQPQRAEFYESFLTLRQLSPAQREEWKRLWLRFLKKLTLRHGPRTLVLKSPAHTAKVSTLLEIFPQARFVHIRRNPYDVFASTLKANQVMRAHSDNLQSDIVDLAEPILNSYAKLNDAYLEERRAIPGGHLHEVRFEDLERDPVKEIERTYQALGLPDFAVCRSQLEAYCGQLKTYEKYHHRHRKAGYILYTRMAIGMLPVRRLFRQLEAQQRHDRAGPVRQIVESVCGYGHGRCHVSHYKLARSKQAVAYYSHSAGQLAYSCPYIILCLFHSDLRKSSPY